MLNRKPILIFLVLVTVFTLLAACGGGGEVNTDGGDVQQVGEVAIKLNSASVKSNKVLANFTVDNKGTSDLAIDPLTMFTIRAENEGEEVVMEADPVSCKNTQLQGSVPAGGSLTGDLCWRSDPTLTWPAQATISYGEASWQVTAEE